MGTALEALAILLLLTAACSGTLEQNQTDPAQPPAERTQQAPPTTAEVAAPASPAPATAVSPATEATEQTVGGQAEADKPAATAAPVLTQVSSDREALAALYHATNGPSWTNDANWLTEEPL